MVKDSKSLLSNNDFIAVLKRLKQEFDHFTYNEEKHRLSFEGENKTTYLRLPLHYQYDSVSGELHHSEDKVYIILMVESGSAALAYCEDDQIIEHKIVKSYMVRKKQGKSQIKHLKTKGKSKAGSRVRLANTEHFFEEIHERMDEWLNYYDIETIALSCSKTLYPYLFSEEFSLNRKDKRIVKIPKHIPEANFDNLLKVHEFLLNAELIEVEI